MKDKRERDATARTAEEAAILQLHPTQLAVGMQQVREKARKLRRMSRREQRDFLAARPVPVVRGPEGRLYLLDHHHLCAAALDAGLERVAVEVRQDWGHLSRRGFWDAMHAAGYVWLFDEQGRPVALDAFPDLLPTTVRGLRDDPYRSVAALARKRGAYAKDWTPFAEFRWANYMRPRLRLGGGDESFSDQELERALQLARLPGASGLPGFLAGGDGITGGAERA